MICPIGTNKPQQQFYETNTREIKNGDTSNIPQIK